MKTVGSDVSREVLWLLHCPGLGCAGEEDLLWIWETPQQHDNGFGAEFALLWHRKSVNREWWQEENLKRISREENVRKNEKSEDNPQFFFSWSLQTMWGFLQHFHVPATACADHQSSGIVFMRNLHSACMSTTVAKWIAKP